MSDKTMRCDDEQLLMVLRCGECRSDHEALIEHVEHCTHCQLRLEQLAASHEDWIKVAEALSTSTSAESDDELGALGALRTTHWGEPPIEWTESIAQRLLSPPSHPEMLGKLGRYDVEKRVGSGGMGVVFKAFDTELNRPVAIKVLLPHLAGNGSARKRFIREARAAAAVIHDHVVPIHTVETERETPFLVMQYIAGESLQERIDREGPLELCEILRIGMQAAAGLAAAHQQGLVHRDIKPSNVLLEPSVERALITDFGLARAADDATLTQTGFHPGTPQYMSPEQASGDTVDARSDLFSLGGVLYAMCTGRPPFRAETSLAVLRRITDDEPRSIQEINPSIPAWLCAIIVKLMAKLPEERYRSADEVARFLEQCLAHVQQPTAFALPIELQVANSKGRRLDRGPAGKWVAACVAVCLMMMASVVIVLEWSKGTLTIETDAENVPIRVRQGDKTVEKLTVSHSKQRLRLAAGNYIVEIDGNMNDLVVDNGTVTLNRGGGQTVKIVPQVSRVVSTEINREELTINGPVKDGNEAGPSEYKNEKRATTIAQTPARSTPNHPGGNQSSENEKEIQWSQPTNGVRLGLAWHDKVNPPGKFQPGDRPRVTIFLQNSGPEEIDTGFEPTDACKDLLHVSRVDDAETVECKPLERTDSNPRFFPAPLSANYKKLGSENIRRLNDDVTGRLIPQQHYKNLGELAAFQIVRSEHSQDDVLLQYSLPNGKYHVTATLMIYVGKNRFQLSSGALYFDVAESQ